MIVSVGDVITISARNVKDIGFVDHLLDLEFFKKFQLMVPETDCRYVVMAHFHLPLN